METLTSLSNNPYFAAGFGLFGVGALAAVGRKSLQVGLVLFRRHCLTSMEVPCNDKSYLWLLKWITRNGASKTQHISVKTTFDEATYTGHVQTHYDLIPSLGTHFFRHKASRTWIKVERTREQQQLDIIGGAPWETLILTALGQRKQLFTSILDEARCEALKEYEGKTLTFHYQGCEWRQFGTPKAKRPLDSVILAQGLKEKIVHDLEEFIGSGKTSLILALAGHFNRSICVLNLSDQDLTDNGLAQRISEAPEDAFLLLEDIDATFVSRTNENTEVTTYRGLNRLTFSGLLNALDGVGSAEARILFMTTNYRQQLDNALIRPGRVDLTAHIGYCDKEQIICLISNFYASSINRKEAEHLASIFLNQKLQLTAAQIQGILLQHKEDFCSLTNLALVQSHFSDSEDSP